MNNSASTRYSIVLSMIVLLLQNGCTRKPEEVILGSTEKIQQLIIQRDLAAAQRLYSAIQSSSKYDTNAKVYCFSRTRSALEKAHVLANSDWLFQLPDSTVTSSQYVRFSHFDYAILQADVQTASDILESLPEGWYFDLIPDTSSNAIGLAWASESKVTMEKLCKSMNSDALADAMVQVLCWDSFPNDKEWERDEFSKVLYETSSFGPRARLETNLMSVDALIELLSFAGRIERPEYHRRLLVWRAMFTLLRVPKDVRRERGKAILNLGGLDKALMSDLAVGISRIEAANSGRVPTTTK